MAFHPYITVVEHKHPVLPLSVRLTVAGGFYDVSTVIVGRTVEDDRLGQTTEEYARTLAAQHFNSWSEILQQVYDLGAAAVTAKA